MVQRHYNTNAIPSAHPKATGPEPAALILPLLRAGIKPLSPVKLYHYL